MFQNSVYNIRKKTNVVALCPSLLDKNLDKHILALLEKKVKGKSIEDGIVIKINGIEYEKGVIAVSQFETLPVIYNVHYTCLLCEPKEKNEMICIVDNFIKGYIIGKNGPIIAAIQLSYIDSKKFRVENDTLIRIKDKRKMQKSDHIKVVVRNVRINVGESTMTSVCDLIDYATDAEISIYNNEQKENLESNDEDDVFM